MARVSDAVVLGLLAVLPVTTTDAFFQPPPASLLRLMRPPSSLSEAAPAPGAWRARPSRSGVVLHARWRFWRRDRDAEKEEGTQDTAQQTLAEQATPAAVSSVNTGGSAQSEEETAAAAAAAVDASSIETPVQSQDSETVAVAADDSSSGSSTQSQEAEASAAAAAAATIAGESVQVQEMAQTGAAADASSTGEVEQREAAAAAAAATAVGTAAIGGVGAEAGAGGTQMVAPRSGRRAAARAAVAVVERMQRDDARRQKRKDGSEYDFDRQSPRTTRDAMFNIVTKQANVTESEGARAVQTYVCALGSLPLLSAREVEELIEKIEERASSETKLSWAYASEWDDKVPSIYDDDLLAGIGARAPAVWREIDAVLLSKPSSTEFSTAILEDFTDWCTPEPADAGALEQFSGNRFDEKVRVKNAFFGVRFVLASVAGAAEAKNLSNQLQTNEVGEKAFQAMGCPEESLIVSQADVDRFVQEVVPSFATLREKGHPMAASGVRLIRCQLRDPFTTPADASRAMKAVLRETGMDKKVKAFLTRERGLLDIDVTSLAQFSRQAIQLESNLGADEEINQTLWQRFAADNVSGFASETQEGGRLNFVVLLVPAATKPSEDTVLGEEGRRALAFGAPITLCAFLGDAFNGSPLEIASTTPDGDLHLLAQAGILGATMIGLLLARDAARFAAAKKGGVELAKPLALPSFDTGVLARRISFASYPSNAEDLFDIVLAGPLVGLAASTAALLVGLQMTAAAGTEALAGFPSLPSSLLQGSSFVGSLVDAFLHTNLGAQDIVAERIAMHPLAVGGAVAMLWNAATVLPLPGSDGKTAIDTLNNELPVAAVASFLATTFVALEFIAGGGSANFLASVLVTSIVTNPGTGAPLIREDNVTPVRSPLRLVLGFLVAALAIVVLTPMTVSPFLTGGSLSVDPGAGAESVAAGLGVGGLGFRGFL